MTRVNSGTRRTVTILFLSTVLFWLGSEVAQAAEIHKWVDENGQTHYGDVIPDRYKTKSQKIDVRPVRSGSAVSERPASGAVQSRPRTEKAVEPARPGQVIAEDMSDEAQEESEAQGVQDKEELARRKFEESRACFDKYKNRNGSNKPEAYTHCPDYKRSELE